MTIYLKNFYSSIQHINASLNRAFDEGPILNIAATGVNTSSIATSEIDPFRQGVEITQNKYAYAGLMKISAGTPGHIINPVCIGANDNITIVSSEYYSEVDLFDPVRYIKLGTTAERSKMIATEEDFLDRKLVYNGVIEPLAIRALEGFLFTEVPYTIHSIKGNISNGNTNDFWQSDDQILTVDYVSTNLVEVNGGRRYDSATSRQYENKSFFLDNYVESNNAPGSGSLMTVIPKTLPTNSSVKYYLVDLSGSNLAMNKLGFFDDSKTYLFNLGISANSHGQDMVNVFTTMTGSTGNYVPPGKKSATTGFVYDNIGYAGTDSIAFGGITY